MTGGETGRGRSEQRPAPAYRLQRSRLWLGLAVIITTVGVAIFARAWWRSLDRPWFPICLVLTLVVGVTAARPWLRRWHTAELLLDPPRLRVSRIVGRSETYGLTEATLELVVTTATGQALVKLGHIFTSVPTEGKRAELIIRTPKRSLMIYARSFRRRALRRFTEELRTALGTDIGESERTRSRLSYIGDTDADRTTIKLNPDMASERGAQVVWLVAATVLGLLLAGAAAISLQGPHYGRPIRPAEAYTGPMDIALDELGIDRAAPVPDDVSVSSRWRRCSREEEWLWGTSDDVESPDFTATAPVARTDERALRERLSSIAEQRSDTRWRRDDPFLNFYVEEGELRLELSAVCLRGDDQEKVAESVEPALAAWAAWLLDDGDG